MSDAQYGIQFVQASWAPPTGAVDLKEGLADGSSINETRNSPDFTVRPTGTGDAHYTKLTDKTGSLSFTYTQESKTHQTLSGLRNTDQLLSNVVGPIVLIDTSTGEKHIFRHARIAGPPNLVRGVEAQSFVWTFLFTEHLTQPGSGVANILAG